ncbi:hypothetical protein [Rugosimonospora africana]|uniref:hypothetical protein n=1 Tax=Rugosimonospora africana TaxID=556532 RepID=UPI001945912B|nr:hypothetical protein [Rugosimonospora africana]
MTPDAAATVAQVDATLLVALVVEAKLLPRQSDETRSANDHSLSMQLGLIGAFASLGVTLMSVVYGRSLDHTATWVADTGTMIGVVPLLIPAVEKIRVRGAINNFFLLAILLVLAIWFFVFTIRFAPGGLFPW